MRMLTGGDTLNAEESAQLTRLTTAVMTHYADWSANDHQEGERRVSFLQTGSAWLRDLAVHNTSNWSRIGTDTIRHTMVFSRDDPITYGNCVHVLCLLCSVEETSRMIREDKGMEEIIDYLPIQFPGKRGEVNPSHTFTVYNKNLRFTLRTLRHLTELYDEHPHTSRRSNLEKVLDTLHSWMSDETSQGLTLEVLYNLIKETDTTGKWIQQHSPPDPDTVIDLEPPEEVQDDRTEPRAHDVLYRLEIKSHKIEKLTRILQNNPSQHHVTQVLGRKILQALTPRGFSLDIRTPEVQELRWSHQISGTCFDTLPDLEEVTIILSYWHCLKEIWHSQAGTILVPSSGNTIKLSQMLLWNHPSMTMKPFSLGISAYDETRGLHAAIPLTTTILALGHKLVETTIHLILPDWESGHQDSHPQHNHKTAHVAKQILESKLLPSAWLHDGGEALGNLGIKILGGYKLAPYTASPSRLRVKVIDHHMNSNTPWSRNTQLFPHRLRIPGNPRTQAIDLHIPTYPGQTSLEATLLTLRILGCGDHSQFGETISVFRTSHTLRTGPDHQNPYQANTTAYSVYSPIPGSNEQIG